MIILNLSLPFACYANSAVLLLLQRIAFVSVVWEMCLRQTFIAK